MGTQRLKVIPDRIFHKIWLLSLDHDAPDDFIASVIHGTRAFKGDKYGLDYVETLEFLKTVFELSHLTFADIVASTGCKKSEISHIFCIPIRTVEDWYSGRNKAPSYVNIMIMKQFHLFRLGKYVRLESDITHAKTQPAIYSKRTPKKAVLLSYDAFDSININEDEKHTPTWLNDEFDSNTEYEEYLDRIVAESVKNRRNRAKGDA